jgi:glutamate-1-semialdehyde 2,1-aminomutase
MITGFRWSLQGAGHYFGVTPDLMTFGKAMGNGFSVAALAGRRDIMEVGAIDKQGAERTFLLSTTHGGEMCGLGAFIETMSIYQESDVCRYLWAYGAKLKAGMNNIASDLGIGEFFEVIGSAISLNYVTRDAQGSVSAAFRTLFAQEMIKSRVLIPWIAVSLSHTDKELGLTLDACYKALQIYKEALAKGVDKYLVGSEVKPVFRKYN